MQVAEARARILSQCHDQGISLYVYRCPCGWLHLSKRK